MDRTTPPFRADHVGSLVRPPELVQARADYAAGKIDAAALSAAEDTAIRDVVKMQEDIGLHGVTDGEFRRTFWHIDFYKGIGGFEDTGGSNAIAFHNASGDVPVVVDDVRVTQPVRMDNLVFANDFAFLKSTTSRTAKLTIPSPSVLHRRGGASFIDAGVYSDLDKFWEDLNRVYAEEVAGLAALGCTYLQLDDTSFATLCDPAHRAQVTEMGGDGEHVHETYIRLINEAVKGRPADMAVTIHTCRGNYKGAWFAEGGYEYIAEAMFNELDVDGFFLEYDDERAGDFAPLRHLPKGKMAVLGLVTTKRATLENKDDIKRRIEEAAQHVPLDQLCLSPQCGFASVHDGQTGSIDDEKAKLALIVEVANEIWG